MVLILVMFVIALATILVVSLTYSTYLGARLTNTSVRNLQAEYLLKSALTLARVLIQHDKSSFDESLDPWRPFSAGIPIPPEAIAFPDASVVVELEIRPEESKIALQSLPFLGETNHDRWRDVLVRLFKQLGFDEDQEVDQSGLFPDRHFASEELFANLMDYMDGDNESYEDRNSAFVTGVEGQLPPGTLLNQRISRLGELNAIPGFTANRVRKLTPYVTVYGGSQRVNINFAPRLLLRALHQDLTDNEIDEIVQFRSSESGPFSSSNKNDELQRILSAGDVFNQVNSMLDIESRYFQVIAKVISGPSTFFMRAYVQYEREALPRIRSMEMY